MCHMRMAEARRTAIKDVKRSGRSLNERLAIRRECVTDGPAGLLMPIAFPAVKLREPHAVDRRIMGT